MLQKEQLVKFLEKSYLNKTIESFIIDSDNGTLFTNFILGQGFRGNIKMNNYDIGTGKIGVYYPNTLLKMLTILESDLKIELIKSKEEVKAINFKDKKGKLVKFATSELDIIPSSEYKKAKVDDYEVKINLNAELISDILKANSIIDDASIIFSFESNKLYIKFGNSSNNKDQIKIEVETERVEDIGNMAFSATFLQAVLAVNSKKFKEGTIEINIRGLMRMYFEETDITSEYYLVALSNN